MSIRDFRLPDLGEGLEEGDVVAWHVDVGDTVELNQTVAEIETAKAVVEVPCPFAGTVVDRIGEVGQTLAVGAVLVRIDTDAAADLEVTVDAGPADELAGERPSTGLDADAEPQPLVGYGQREGRGRRRRRGAAAPEDPGARDDRSRVLAKPPVRKLAKDLGVDLTTLAPGTGPDGVITRDDVRRAADGGDRQATSAAGPAAAGTVPDEPPARTSAVTGPPGAGFRGRAPGDVEHVTGVRKRIVEKMELSRRSIPEATCSRWADVTELWRLRHDLTAAAAADGHDVKVTPLAVVLRAVVVALRRFPTLNASMVGRDGDDPGRIELHEAIHLGVAADTERGLVVPVIRDAHRRTTLELATELNRLATAARDGTLTPGELTGGTFTVSNYGAFGNDDGDPVINHPEGALLGVGAMRERPWVVDGELAVRRTCKFTLAFDHRLSDGGEAGRFVTSVGDLCEQPARLLLHT